jgi:hypothetical protein
MKKSVHVLILMLGLGQAAAQDACSSLSALSDDPILRFLQSTLGWGNDSSLYRRCVFEEERSLFYQESDSGYFSSDLPSDLAYRAGVKVPSTPSEFDDNAPVQFSHDKIGASEKERVMTLDKLSGQNYQSIGIFGDQ